MPSGNFLAVDTSYASRDNAAIVAASGLNPKEVAGVEVVSQKTHTIQVKTWKVMLIFLVLQLRSLSFSFEARLILV